MGTLARMKSAHGGGTGNILAITPVTTVDLSLPGNRDVFSLTVSGAVTVPTINANVPIRPGRVIRLIGAAGNAANDITFTNNADTTTKGQMDLGGGNVTLGSEDVLTLIQQDNGVWFEATVADN